MEATIDDAVITRRETHAFYLWMAAAFVVVAFGGFIPTYWARLAAGTFHRAPIFHVHGILFFAWTLFYFAQTAWVANGRVVNHRAWGLFGISLFSVMMCTVLVGQITLMTVNDRLGVGDAGRRFAAVSLGAMPLLIAFFTLAIANVRKPAIHKRLMVLLMAACMTPAIARVFLTFLAPPGQVGSPPPFVSVPPALIADLFVVAAVIYDWRTRGRPHAVYVWGGLALLLQQVAVVPLAATDSWLRIAGAIEKLAG